MKKPASKAAKPAQIQPKSQFLFHKNLPPRDFSIMTLSVNEVMRNDFHRIIKMEKKVTLHLLCLANIVRDN